MRRVLAMGEPRWIADIAQDDTISRGALAQAIIASGHNLRLRVVAEGVDKPEQVSVLEQHGCDEAQGIYFGRPIPAAQFEASLAAQPVHAVAAC